MNRVSKTHIYRYRQFLFDGSGLVFVRGDANQPVGGHAVINFYSDCENMIRLDAEPAYSGADRPYIRRRYCPYLASSLLQAMSKLQHFRKNPRLYHRGE